MIYLVTGMPGNGKTLYAVDFIKKAVDKGRAVYSDIKGLTLVGVQPAPDDWRTLPDGALVVYDEAHKRFPSFKGKGRSPLDVVRDMDEHRHRGFDMMFITQWPDKIDQELFRLVGTHWHLNRAFGLQSASLAAFTRGVMNPYSATARKGADESVWSYPTDLYKVYKSSSMHTDAHKFKLPAKVKTALMSVPVILLALWGFYWFITPKSPEKQETTAAQRSGAETAPASAPIIGGNGMQASSAADKATATGEYFSLTGPTVTPIVGCVDSERGCRCWNQDGLQIDQTQAECRRTVDRPLPINIYRQYAAPSGSTAITGGQVAGQGASAPPAHAQGVSGSVIERQTRALGTFPESPSKAADTYTPPTTLEM
ncbi:zonular occludens toxin domain-containing protein [Xanthomonas translucens]|uniref:zonular occludens toxin domain-containing protein n=1 Tax=Xanthomonas campestris pv. translucens TaxID=343 RepID=UPI00071E88CD|nr:zonular occludens toxin domain-containing protein [Xanthomonas translucens]